MSNPSTENATKDWLAKVREEPHLYRVISREALQEFFRAWRAGEPYPEDVFGTEGCAVSAASDSFAVVRTSIIEDCAKVADANHDKIGDSWNAFQSMACNGGRQAAERISKEIRELKDVE